MNKAVGEAASASMAIGCIRGRGKARPSVAIAQPAAMAQGKGLLKTPRKALVAACRGLETDSFLDSWASVGVGWALPSLDNAMHKDEVTTMSTQMATKVGPAARGPSKLTNKGMPMKPEFGNAATNAPKDALFQSHPDPPLRRARFAHEKAIAKPQAKARATINTALVSQTPKIWGFKI